MKKKVNILILIIIILSIGIGIGYASAISIESKDVVYDNNGTTLSSTDVQGALDEVYAKSNGGNALADNLTSGKTAIVGGELITGTGTDNTTFYNNGYNKGVTDGKSYVDNQKYQEGYNAGYSAGSNIIHTFSGQRIAVCSGRGNCGGQTYLVSWDYNDSKTFDYTFSPAIFSSISYDKKMEEGNDDGYYDCKWNNTFTVVAVDTVTGAEMTSWAANYPNTLRLRAKWSKSSNGSHCNAYAYTEQINLVIR